MWTHSPPDDELVVMRALTDVYGHPMSADALARGESAIRAAATQHDNVIPLAGRRRRLAARVGAGAAAATIALSSAGVAAAAGTAPGQLLYPVKTATEQVWAALTPGDIATAHLHLRFAERRLDELRALQNPSRSQVQALHRAFLDHLATAELLGGDMLAADVQRVGAAGTDAFDDHPSRQGESHDRPAPQGPDATATAAPRPTPTLIPPALPPTDGAAPTTEGAVAGTGSDVPLQQPLTPADPDDHAQNAPRQPTVDQPDDAPEPAADQPVDDAHDADEPSDEEPYELEEPDEADEPEVDEPVEEEPDEADEPQVEQPVEVEEPADDEVPEADDVDEPDDDTD